MKTYELTDFEVKLIIGALHNQRYRIDEWVLKSSGPELVDVFNEWDDYCVALINKFEKEN